MIGPDRKIQEMIPEDTTVPAPRRGKWSLFLRGAVTVILIALILHWVDSKAVLATLAGANPGWIVCIAALALADRYLMSYKWAMLLRGRGVGLSNGEAFRIYLASVFAGTFLPTGVGSDIYRVVRTATGGRRLDTVTASVVIERVIGLLAVLVVGLTGLQILVNRGEVLFSPVCCLTWAGLGLVVALLFLSIQDRTISLMTRLLSGVSHFKPVRVLLKLHAAYVEFSRQGRVLLIFFAWTLLERVVQVLLVYTAARALGIHPHFVYFLALIPVSDLVLLLPISIGGIGLTEGVLMVLLSHAGLSAAESLSTALLLRALGWLLLIPFGFVFLYDSGRLKRLKSPVANPPIKEERSC